MPQYVVCIPDANATVSASPCVDVDGVHYVQAVVEYPVAGQVTFENADLLFGYGFVNVLTIWLIGLGAGLIISLVKKGR